MLPARHASPVVQAALSNHSETSSHKQKSCAPTERWSATEGSLTSSLQPVAVQQRQATPCQYQSLMPTNAQPPSINPVRSSSGRSSTAAAGCFQPSQGSIAASSLSIAPPFSTHLPQILHEFSPSRNEPRHYQASRGCGVMISPPTKLTHRRL